MHSHLGRPRFRPCEVQTSHFNFWTSLIRGLEGVTTTSTSSTSFRLPFCGSLASVRGVLPACPSRVSRIALFCKLRLACELLTSRNCPCTNRSDPVGPDSSLKQPYWTAIGSRFPARTRASLSLRPGGSYTRKSRLSRVSVITCRVCSEIQLLWAT